jgi:uncharacterized membrane protein HdeD (DUF308 family)
MGRSLVVVTLADAIAIGLRATPAQSGSYVSLKVFHILFVVASTALMAFFAAWALRAYAHSHETSQLVLGVVAIVAGVLLLIYGRWFLRKLKNTKLT